MQPQALDCRLEIGPGTPFADDYQQGARQPLDTPGKRLDEVNVPFNWHQTTNSAKHERIV